MSEFQQAEYKSISGTCLTIVLTIFSKITLNDVMTITAIISALITGGYTLDKWMKMRKKYAKRIVLEDDDDKDIVEEDNAAQNRLN